MKNIKSKSGIKWQVVLPGRLKNILSIATNQRNEANRMPRRRIYFGEDEFPRRKQPVLRRHGLEMYTFFPPFIHRDLNEERNGFDCYIVGEIRPGEKMELLTSFQRLEKGRYKKLNLYILQGCNKSECTLVLNFFMLKYARRNNYVFLNCGMRDELK